jgi:general stress protein 26
MYRFAKQMSNRNLTHFCPPDARDAQTGTCRRAGRRMPAAGLRPRVAVKFPAMNKPLVKPIAAEQLVELALAAMRGARFPDLATLDGNQPRVRPVSPVKTDGFTVYVANLRSYHKTGEIAANPHVELCYVDPAHNQVRITGVAEVLADRGLLEAIWQANPLLRQYLGSLDNPELIVYRIRPNRVRYMQEWALEYYEVPLDG